MQKPNHLEKAVREIVREQSVTWLRKKMALIFFSITLISAFLGHGLYYLIRDSQPRSGEYLGMFTFIIGLFVAVYAALTTKRTREYVEVQIDYARKIRADVQKMMESCDSKDIPDVWHLEVEICDTVIDELIEKRKGMRSLDEHIDDAHGHAN